MSAGFWIRRKKAAIKKLKSETVAKPIVSDTKKVAEPEKTPVETPKNAKKGGVKSEKGTN